MTISQIKHAFIILSIYVFFSFVWGAKDVSAYNPFTQAYVTMGNSRFSFKAQLSSAGNGGSVATSNFTISGSPTLPNVDDDTNNLFIGDAVCFNNPSAAGRNGCSANTTYTVANVPTSTNFITSANAGTGSTLTVGTTIVATQSGKLTVTFTPETAVPPNGQVVLWMPAIADASGVGNTDGIPDAAGFDSALLPANLLSTGSGQGSSCPCISSGTGWTFTSAILTPAGTGTTHVVTLGLGSAVGSTLVAGTSYSFTVGHTTDATLRFLNPAPQTSAHVRGVADTLTVTLFTTDGTNTLDKTLLKVAPIDGVFVSANVELTLTYSIAGRNVGTTSCGFPATQTSTAYSVPFGSLTNYSSFNDMAQLHTLTTNAGGGFVLQTYENNVLATGNNGTGQTIPDTTCNGQACTSTSGKEWTGPALAGFGYSAQVVAGGTAAFQYNDGALTYKAAPFPQGAANAATIYASTAPITNAQLYSCYRLAILSTNQTGLYYNNVTYVATPVFK